jgi:putative ABC transport system substrate-binding protein
MKVRGVLLVAGLTAGLFVVASQAEAQQAGKVYRIGYLSPGSPDVYSAAFSQGLRDLGWKEGQDFIIEPRWAAGKSERLSEMARELVEVKPDVIVAITTPAARAAVDATGTIPVVFTMVADPVGSGLVASLARPSRNATGLSFVPELDFFGKQLELLKEIVPGVSRVTILWMPTNPIHAAIVDVTKSAAMRLGLESVSRPVQTLDQIEQAFADLARTGRSACLVIQDYLFYVNRERLAALAAMARVPVMYGAPDHPEAGGLVSYAQDLRDTQRRAAAYVARILRGTEPGQLPIERPSKFELVININEWAT